MRWDFEVLMSNINVCLHLGLLCGVSPVQREPEPRQRNLEKAAAC